MKIRHKIPSAAFRGDRVSPEYQAEVDRATNKAQVAWERAQRRLVAAEQRLARADERVLATATLGQKVQRDAAHDAAVAAELVELRREELRAIEAMMRTPPGGGVQHRGRDSHRHVASPRSQI